jgi:hypothetical protein
MLEPVKFAGEINFGAFAKVSGIVVSSMPEFLRLVTPSLNFVPQAAPIIGLVGV